MNSFKYGDEKISEREIMIAVPSMVIGIGVLTLPGDLAGVMTASDGWFSLLVAGVFFVVFTWVMTTFAARFPNQTFLTYASSIITKPVAIVLTFLFAAIYLPIGALQVRMISAVSKHYLFDQTPIEVIGLVFLLVVVYAVSGSRVGLLRLNMMFLPIILLIAVIVFVFSVVYFEPENLLPVFQSSFNDHVKGMHVGVTSYIGVGIVLFYTALIDQPKKAPKKATLGMCIPVVLYIIVYIMCIGVFGNTATSNILYPTVELAKSVEIPGGFLERFESIFFVIWIMAIFNTTVMALDIAVLAIHSVFKNTKKINIVLIFAPIVYSISMFPQDLTEVMTFSTFVGNTTLIYTLVVTILLMVVAKVRGVK